MMVSWRPPNGLPLTRTHGQPNSTTAVISASSKARSSECGLIDLHSSHPGRSNLYCRQENSACNHSLDCSDSAELHEPLATAVIAA